MKKLTKSHIIFVMFFLLVIANSRYLIDKGISAYIEYFVHGSLTVLCCYTFIKSKREDKSEVIKKFFVVMILFVIGIIVQRSLLLSTKIRLIFTMVALATYIILSGNLLNDYKNIRIASYGMFIGTIVTTFIGIITETSMNEVINDQTYKLAIDTGFTGGLQYKNYYASVILASFIGIYLYYKNVHRNKTDFITLIILFVLELISGSKGGYLLFACFIALQKIGKIKKKIKFSKGLRYIMTIIAIIILGYVLSFLLQNVLSNSNTYIYRIRGVKNYIKCVRNDYFHLIFGNADMAYSTPSYVQNIRNYLVRNNTQGYNGSYEMGFINTLIKNGILGLIGFAISYYTIIKKALACTNKEYKITIISILTMLLISSLVESYVCNIHAIFGVYCYILMAGLINMSKNNKDSNKQGDGV